MRIEIPVFDGFDELDAVGPFEVLRNAALAGANWDAALVGADGPGCRQQARDGRLPAALAEIAPSAAWTASVCTGAMLLAEAGLVTGRPATTHRNALADLSLAGALVVAGARVVDDGDLLTAAGVTSGLDLALWLVEREYGPDAASTVSRGMEYERRGEVYRRSR
ncbi:MAG: DJ-1/PfpI family protein [Actinomycetales bacterium]|nr:DJ-1/PfpI family protein [Actinomycetales bacterium]